jgi:hypothetical protein
MNGNGKIEGLLERIATTLDGVREEQVRMREEQVRMREDTHEALVDVAVRIERTREQLTDEVAGLRGDMNRGFAQVNARIDNVLAIAGDHHDDHEQRIQVLEAAVLGKQSG